MNKKILILYSEVMPYTMAMLHTLTKIRKDITFKVYQYGQDKKLSSYIPVSSNENLILLDESLYNQEKLIAELDSSPLAVVVSGRMQKKYLNTALAAKKKGIKTICLSDAQYEGSFRQSLACLLSYYFYRRYYDAMHVSGLYQYEYARRLGFASRDIRMGIYSANVDLFNDVHYKRLEAAKFEGFLFIGRFVHVKSIDLIIEAYQYYLKNTTDPQKLILVGDGPLKNLIPKSPHIVVHQYLEQQELAHLMITAKCFLLPSRDEPWGVVVHEAAAAGLPIITTASTGASTSFVKHNYNGQIINTLNASEIFKSMKFMTHLNLKDIKDFGQRSYELSKSITPELSATQLMNLIES